MWVLLVFAITSSGSISIHSEKIPILKQCHQIGEWFQWAGNSHDPGTTVQFSCRLQEVAEKGEE